MASYEHKEWQATPPWNQETPLQSLNNLRGLLHNPPNALQSELPDSFPYVQGLMEEVIEGIMEEAQVMSRTLGAVYAEYRLHYGDSREYVRIWKCVDVQPYQRKDYSNAPATQPGEYYEWQKMKNVDIHIRRTWRAQNEWQMLTKNQEEQQLLTANDPPKQPINVTSIVQNAIESSSSDEKQSSVGRIVAALVLCVGNSKTLQDDADADIQQHSSQIQITTGNIGSCWLYGTDFRFCSSDHSWPVHFEPTWECRCSNVNYSPPSGGVCVKTPRNRVKWFLTWWPWLRMPAAIFLKNNTLDAAVCADSDLIPSDTFRHVRFCGFFFEIYKQGVGVWLRSLQPTKTLLMS